MFLDCSADFGVRTGQRVRQRFTTGCQRVASQLASRYWFEGGRLSPVALNTSEIKTGEPRDLETWKPGKLENGTLESESWKPDSCVLASWTNRTLKN